MNIQEQINAPLYLLPNQSKFQLDYLINVESEGRKKCR